MAVGIGLSEFEDFDKDEVYERCENALKQASTRNIIIEFDQDSAKAVVNINDLSMGKFLDTKRPKKDSTRWINIWGPERQEKLVKALSDRYNFTPRLLGIICSKHSPKATRVQHDGRPPDETHLKSHFRSLQPPYSDPEKNSRELQARIKDPLSNLNHYNVVNEVWHYFSVDWGFKCRTATIA